MKKLLAVVTFLILAAGNSYAQSNIFTLPGPNIPGLITNGSNLTSTVPLLLPNGSASAPALAFASEPTKGWWRRDSNTWGFGVVPYSPGFTLAYSGTLSMVSGGYIQWTNSATDASTTSDVLLFRDTAGTLALRNSTNPQTFNIYNTYTDGSNYERGVIAAQSGNHFKIATQAAGTGTARNISIEPSGGFVYFTGNAAPGASDTYSLGGGTYWNNLYLTRSIQGSKNKSLTDAGAAASIVRIAVPTNGFAAGRIIYTATSTDGTNILVTSGSCNFAAADTGGTVTAGAPVCDTPATAYKRANTLVCTFSGAVATTNYDIQVTCTDNLAGTQTMSINYRLDMPQPNTVTPQ